MSVKTPIHDFLVNYSKKGFTRCHMPGNKGRNFAHDISEIHGAGNLYAVGADFMSAHDIIAESEQIAARLFGAEKTLYSCSGSTLAIQAMLALIKTAGGSRISAFRYAHRSFISVCALLDFEVDWIYPDEFLSAKLNPADVKDGADAVFVNSLDYYGGACDIKSFADISSPLLVDNAHGAYLVLTGNHPILQGAAMTADSAHKTLPALTGAAYLHVGDKRFITNAKAMTALFGTSSPSYLILESLDLCNKHIAQLKESGAEAFEFIAELKSKLPARESDPLRITINAREYGYSGIELAAELRKNKVECEYADENCTVLLFSTITTRTETDAVQAAFSKIAQKKPLTAVNYPVLKPERAMSVRNALFAPVQNCAVLPLEEAIGKVCAEVNAPCPPGVPLIMPGEIISREVADLLKSFGVKSIRITN